MKIVWKTVTGSQEERPETIDKTSSSKYVYLHRNIKRITQDDGQGNKIELWQYEEAVVTQEEYAQYDTVVMELVQAEISNLAYEQAKQNAVMQANIDYLAMMTGVDMDETEGR